MQQIWIIHGGESFLHYDDYLHSLKSKIIDYERLKLQRKWKSWISMQLTEYDVLLPTLPNGNNAVYDEWKTYFEKLIPFFLDDVQLVGHSLGAMFLAKYLHENLLPKKAHRIILISGGYNDDTYEDLGSFGVSSAKNLEKSTEEIHLFHSTDDPVVPFSELAKFQADLPNAISHVFENKGHFNQETFPELLGLLQKS